jgi:hypothetical protein
MSGFPIFQLWLLLQNSPRMAELYEDALSISIHRLLRRTFSLISGHYGRSCARTNESSRTVVGEKE